MADETNEQKEEFNKDEFVAGIKAKYAGAADVALSVLGQEAKEYRDKIRNLKKQLPPEGAIVLSGDDAKLFANFKGLVEESKLDLKAIKERLGKVEELETQNKQLARAEQERDAAEAAGFKLSTFRRLMKDFPDAAFEIKTEKTKDNKEAKVAYITNGDKESPLSEFANENFADFLPALKQVPDEQPIKKGNTYDPTPHAPTKADAVHKEVQAQMATGRYSL